MARSLKTYIMCGGSGTRLWPLSRADNPKQMLALLGQRSMLDETIRRTVSMPLDRDISVNIIGADSQHEDLTALAHVDGVLLEPMGRNTAAAVALAALHAREDMDPYVLILPSDHEITTSAQFAESVSAGMRAADDGTIVTFGIEPDRPATGYGYIEAVSGDAVSDVKTFVEKPDRITAEAYVASGRHLWNAGIFLARCSVLLDALMMHAPDILEATQHAFEKSHRDDKACRFDPSLYEAIRSQSIDYAVMEKAENVRVVRAAFSWSDIGSFDALKDGLEADEAGNAVQGDVVSLDSSGNLLRSEGPLLTTLGVNNFAVIATPDATFVSPLARSEEVREIVSKLEEKQRRELYQTPWKAECGVVPGAMSDRLRDWLFDLALPYWSERGPDREHGGFHEVLDFDGKSIAAQKRLRTMARQTYVFAKAAEMGWQGDAKAVIQHGLAFFEHAETAAHGGWFKTFDAAGQPADRSEDVYDHAFVLLAAAQSLKVGMKQALPIAERVLAFLRTMEIHTSDGGFAGYHEDCLGTLPRRANPHMHLLEAFLAWYEATGDQEVLNSASQIVELFTQHFCCRQTMFLREEFDKDLHVNETTSRHMEPGHHFEWAWLLHWYARASGTPLLPQMRVLIASAKAFGINPVSRLAHDRVEADGAPSHHTSRCWPQTELLKAELAMTRHGMPHANFAAERSAQRLWRHHVEPAPAGLWNDVSDVTGKPVSTSVPASTFYHLICAIDVYLRCHSSL